MAFQVQAKFILNLNKTMKWNEIQPSDTVFQITCFSSTCTHSVIVHSHSPEQRQLHKVEHKIKLGFLLNFKLHGEYFWNNSRPLGEIFPTLKSLFCLHNNLPSLGCYDFMLTLFRIQPSLCPHKKDSSYGLFKKNDFTDIDKFIMCNTASFQNYNLGFVFLNILSIYNMVDEF